MKQRNATPYELIATCDPPLVIAPGEVVDHEFVLTGCEIVEDEEAPPTKDAKTTKDAAPTKTPEEPVK